MEGGAPMAKRNRAAEYDPGDIFSYLGAEFFTEHGDYRVGEDGRFYGRATLDRAQISLIAAVKEEDFQEARSCLESDLKHVFDNLIFHKGLRPAAGLHLVISLTDDEAEKRGRNGLVSSRLKKIRRMAQ